MASRGEIREVPPEHGQPQQPPGQQQRPSFSDRAESLAVPKRGGPGGERTGTEAGEGRQDGREHPEPITIPGEDGFEEGRDARQQAAAKAHDRVTEGLADIDGRLQDRSLYEAWVEVAEAAGISPERLNDVQETIGLLKQTADEMFAAGSAEASSLALEAVSAASVIEGDLAEMQDAAGSVESPSGSIVARTLAWVMKRWAGIARWLWRLISNLLTPRQWSLTGGIELHGLANASISITFGE